MKHPYASTLITIFCLALIALLPTASLAAAPQAWTIQTVDTGNVGEATAIALDTAGRPHISYYDRANADLKYAYYDGTSWHTETVDSAGDVGLWTALALDSQNYPHIAYYDNTNRDLKYAYYDGTSWHTETADSAGDVGRYVSMVLDSTGQPHLAYYNATDRALKYAYRSLPATAGEGRGQPAAVYTWSNQTIDTAQESGKGTAIALDSAGHAHISYYRYILTSGWGVLKYAHYDGSAWHSETVDQVAYAWVGYYNSLVLDSNDRPHIAYNRLIQRYQLKYAYWNGSAWQISVVPNAGTGYYARLQLNAAGQPLIAHSNIQTGEIKLNYYDGSQWQTQVVENVGTASSVSFALQSNGMLHLAYRAADPAELHYAVSPPLPAAVTK